MTEKEEKLRAHCMKRISICREQELKFGAYIIGKMPQALCEAWTERRTLEEILEFLDE